jgi:hypothetical protein
MNATIPPPMKLSTFRLLLAACLLAGAWLAAPAAGQDITRDPDAVRLMVDDIRRFAEVLQQAEGEEASDRADLIQREYLAKASPGLHAYAQQFGVTGESLSKAVDARPAFYADLHALADLLLAQEETLRPAFRELQALFPGAVFPPVWFVVGGHGPRGQASPVGALIGAEGFLDRPQDIAPLVLHELAHFQSGMIQGVEVYRRIYEGPHRSLLAIALREGSAELIAELTTGRHTNPAAERYGLAHEAALWGLFSGAMHGPDTGDWLWVRPANPDWPPDLGYWIGYRIVRAYYDRAKDKRQAIQDILALTDFEAFLEASGYAERFGP